MSMLAACLTAIIWNILKFGLNRGCIFLRLCKVLLFSSLVQLTIRYLVSSV